MIREIDKRINRAMGRIRQAFRGVINTVNTAPGVSLLQVSGMAGETAQDNELFQDYGFSSVPPAGTECVVLPIGGKTSQGIIIATEHAAYRIKALQGGEVAIYTAEGDSIVLKNGHLIEVTTQTLKINAATKVEMNTPLLQVNDGDIKADDISLKNHRTSEVQSGTGVSGVPVV